MTMQIPQRNVAIAGAGLAGTLMAMYLARRGWNVEIYERRADPRQTRIYSGRSINMTLAIRGLAALAEVMDVNKVLELTMRVEGRMVHGLDGSLKFHPYGVKSDEVIYAISRSALNIRLLDIAEKEFPNIKILFNHRFHTIDTKNWAADIYDEVGRYHKFITPDFIVGADGTFSTVRQQVQRNGYANFRQEYLEAGYKELVFAAGPNRSFQMASNALHLWPRGKSMLMAIPNRDGTFACNCILPFDGTDSFADLTTSSKVMDFFRDKFPDAVDIIEGLPNSFLRNPPAAFPSTWAYPWHSGDRIVLIGDACHTVVPFYGLGMNAAFEDCSALNQCIEKHGTNLGLAFQEYQELRKVNTDALAEMSLQNFIELRDKVRSPILSARKKVFTALHRVFPNLVVPLYTMMSHTKMPFAEARRRANLQDRWARCLGIDLIIWLVAAFQICTGLFRRVASVHLRQPQPTHSVLNATAAAVHQSSAPELEPSRQEQTVSHS